MKRFLALVMFACLACGCETKSMCGPFMKLGEPVKLFNGKDLDNWTWFGEGDAPPAKMAIWSVVDGVLVTNGRHNGYIRTTNMLGENYALDIEYRHVTEGNGGFQFGVRGPDKIWPACIEVQGESGAVGEMYNLGSFRWTVDPARAQGRRVFRLGPSAEKSIGEWNTLFIVVDNGYLNVTLNKTQVNQARDVESLNGQFALQSEGSIMEFRKIELRPIIGHSPEP